MQDTFDRIFLNLIRVSDTSLIFNVIIEVAAATWHQKCHDCFAVLKAAIMTMGPVGKAMPYFLTLYKRVFTQGGR